MAKSNSKSSICAPAILYLILAIIGLIAMAVQKFGALSLLFKAIFVGIWTWFLNFLCNKGYKTISWILVILPFVMFILMFFICYEIIKNNTKENFQNDDCYNMYNSCNANNGIDCEIELNACLGV